MRALQQAAQSGVAPLQALVHLQPAKERLRIHTRVARPGRHALRQRARRQHLCGDAQRQRLAKLARARKEDAAAGVHAAQQVCNGARLVHQRSAAGAHKGKVWGAQRNAA